MNELMMYKYLNKMGMNGRNEHKFMDKFKEFMRKHKEESRRHNKRDDDSFFNDNDSFYSRRNNKLDDFMNTFSSRNDYSMPYSEDNDFHRFMKSMREAMAKDDHFDEDEAEYIVSKMYHTENGRKCSGEKYDMHKAKEIRERYRGVIPSHVEPIDVYVAINAQYHNYAELFKTWFPDGTDLKIIESAILFWFKDMNTDSPNKVVDYFRNL